MSRLRTSCWVTLVLAGATATVAVVPPASAETCTGVDAGCNHRTALGRCYLFFNSGCLVYGDGLLCYPVLYDEGPGYECAD